MRRWIAFLTLVLPLATATAAARAETVTVAAAISLKESMEQIGKAYHARTGVDVRLTFDASGRLAAQIRQGAPVDAFVSAGQAEVDALVAGGQADKASRRTVVGNTLVLIVPAGSTGGPTSIADLAHATGKLAIGNPKSVPAGHYAQQVLDKLQLTAAVRPRLVMGENVRQVLTYVEQGVVAAGFVYGTDAKAAGDKVRVVATADAADHDPIEYPAVTIVGTAHAAAAKAFLDDLATPASRAVFQAHGFSVPKAPATKP